MSDRSCKMCRKWMASAVEYGDLCYGCCQSELTHLRSQLAAKERKCEELRTHLVATANQVQDNCWCAPGDKCPAHAARDYLQEITP